MNRHSLAILSFLGLMAGGCSTESNAELALPGDDFDSFQEGITHGEMEKISYPSTTVGTERLATVYTPPGYSDETEYPVLYLLHGIGGDENEWPDQMNPHHILDNLLANNQMEPMVVVMPNGRAMENDKAEGDIFSPDKIEAFTRFEQDLLDDLIPFIESHYSVSTNASERALAGLSMGGGQALNIGLTNLEHFSAVGAFSAAPNTMPPAQLIPEPNDIAKELDLLFLSCGDADSLFHVSENVQSYLEEHHIPHVWYELEGDHVPENWSISLYLFAQSIFN